MAKLDYYDCLGLTQDATQAEIKRAFRRMVRVCHPDLNPEDSDAAERLQDIVTAYDTLGDPELRGRYDRINNLFGPRMRSREEVVDEKTFAAMNLPYGGRVHLTSLRSRRAQARGGALFFLALLAVSFGIVLWGVMSDGFTRNPFRYVPRWRVMEQPLPGSGVFSREPVVVSNGDGNIPPWRSRGGTHGVDPKNDIKSN